MNPSDPDRSELDAVDDAALNEYLRRDSAVSQRYRDLGSDDVPASLDQAVLAQARAAVADKKPSRWRNMARWSAPLALAASVLLVVSIVLQPSMQSELSRMTVPAAAPLPKVMEERSVSQPMEMKEKQEAARADAAAESAPVFVPPPAVKLIVPAPASAPPPAEKAKEAGSSSPPASMRQQIRSTTAIAPPPPRQEAEGSASSVAPKQPEPAAAPVVKNESAAADARRRDHEPSDEARLEEAVVTGSLVQRPAVGAGPRGTVQPSRSMADTPGEEFDKNDPSSWLDYIRRLRAEGESSRADGEWRRFRRQYPDFIVEESDAARPRRR